MTHRKNQTPVWPTDSHFTFQTLHTLNPNFVAITLRTHLMEAVETKAVAEIGLVPGGKGRPPKVYALTPVTKTILAKAEQDGIIMADNANILVSVPMAAPTTKPSTKPSTMPSTMPSIAIASAN